MIENKRMFLMGQILSFCKSFRTAHQWSNLRAKSRAKIPPHRLSEIALRICNNVFPLIKLLFFFK